MVRGFGGKVYVLCGMPSHGRGEHVWQKWLSQDLADEGPFATSVGGKPLVRRDGSPDLAPSLGRGVVEPDNVSHLKRRRANLILAPRPRGEPLEQPDATP